MIRLLMFSTFWMQPADAPNVRTCCMKPDAASTQAAATQESARGGCDCCKDGWCSCCGDSCKNCCGDNCANCCGTKGDKAAEAVKTSDESKSASAAQGACCDCCGEDCKSCCGGNCAACCGAGKAGQAQG